MIDSFRKLVRGLFAGAQVATVYLTVHGTGDSAPAPSTEEKKWWEPDSRFCKALLAEAGGHVRIEPFVWSGANDERERRRAAKRLYARISDTTGNDVVLVGHSHGGSVVLEALRIAAARKRNLPQLARWVTIGTPFIQMRRKRFAFNRLDLVGQAALVCALPVAMGLLISLPATFAVFMNDGLYLAQPSIGLGIALAFLLAILVPEEIGSRRRASARFASQLYAQFGERWRGCVSRHDEATNGLERLPQLRIRLFGRDSFQTAIRFAVAMIFIGNLLLSQFSGNAPIETLLPLGIYELRLLDPSQMDLVTWYRTLPATLTLELVSFIDEVAKSNLGAGVLPYSELDGYAAFIDFALGPVIALTWTFVHMITAMFVAQVLLG